VFNLISNESNTQLQQLVTVSPLTHQFSEVSMQMAERNCA